MTPIAERALDWSMRNDNRGRYQRDKEFCSRGHELSGDNVRVYRDVSRRYHRNCMECSRQRSRERRDRMREISEGQHGMRRAS